MKIIIFRPLSFF
jgi:tyrosine-protein phosphatase non-receptor type 14/21